MAKKTKKNEYRERPVLDIWRRFCRNRTALAGLIVITCFAVIALFAEQIMPFSAAVKQDATVRLARPSAEHWFGTDGFGRDLFARVIHGARVSLSVGFATTFVALSIGAVLGAACGYFGRFFDSFVMRCIDIFACIPGVLLALAIVSTLGAGMTNLLIAITISSVPGYTRMLRSVILTIVELDFIDAARACGTKDMRIIFRHVLPNAIGPIIVQASMSVASMMLIAAGLSFIGMGMQPPNPEWGVMLSDAREYMRTSPHLMIFPGAAICISALALNLIGDGLRDALDPRLKT